MELDIGLSLLLSKIPNDKRIPASIIIFPKFYNELYDTMYQFSLLLFIKIKKVFLICVSCHPFHDISKTPNYYRVTLRTHAA